MGDSDEGASDRPSEEEPPKDSFFIADHLRDTKASLLIAPGVPTVASDRTEPPLATPSTSKSSAFMSRNLWGCILLSVYSALTEDY